MSRRTGPGAISGIWPATRRKTYHGGLPRHTTSMLVSSLPTAPVRPGHHSNTSVRHTDHEFVLGEDADLGALSFERSRRTSAKQRWAQVTVLSIFACFSSQKSQLYIAVLPLVASMYVLPLVALEIVEARLTGRAAAIRRAIFGSESIESAAKNGRASRLSRRPRCWVWPRSWCGY